MEVMRVMEPMLKKPMRPSFFLLFICKPIKVGIRRTSSVKSATDPKAA